MNFLLSGKRILTDLPDKILFIPSKLSVYYFYTLGKLGSFGSATNAVYVVVKAVKNIYDLSNLKTFPHWYGNSIPIKSDSYKEFKFGTLKTMVNSAEFRIIFLLDLID